MDLLILVSRRLAPTILGSLGLWVCSVGVVCFLMLAACASSPSRPTQPSTASASPTGTAVAASATSQSTGVVVHRPPKTTTEPVATVMRVPPALTTATSSGLPLHPTAPAGRSTQVVGPAQVTPSTESCRRFQSSVNPYSICLPDGWTAKPGATIAGDVKGDFFLPPSSQEKQVSVNVLSEPLEGQTTSTDRYAELTSDQISQDLGVKPERAETIKVADTDAVVLKWTDSSRPLKRTEVTQAVWVQDGRGWVATLRAHQGQSDSYVPVFKKMLRTLQDTTP